MYMCRTDAKRLNRSILGTGIMLSGAILWGTTHMPQPDDRQKAMQRLSENPSGTFEIMAADTIGPSRDVLVYKGSEEFDSIVSMDRFNQPQRRICSKIFLYHAQFDPQHPQAIGLHYAPTDANIINNGETRFLPVKGNQTFVPEVVVKDGQVLYPPVIATQTICRMAPL